MPRTTPVSVIMTRNVQTLDVSSKLSTVRRALLDAKIHHMPIVDEGRLVGIVSGRDLVRAYRAGRGSEPGDARNLDDILDRYARLDELMTTDLVTLESDEPIDRAIDLIADGHIHSVLILDPDGRLAGIVTDKNIVDYLAD